MKLLILGASGGRPRALTRGNAVTALVRSPEKLQALGGSIRIEKGSPQRSRAGASPVSVLSTSVTKQTGDMVYSEGKS